MEGELEALSPVRPSRVSSKGDGHGFGSPTRASPLETLMDSPLSCVSHGSGGGSDSVFSPPTGAPSLETQLKSPSSCISDNRGGGNDFGFSSPTRVSLLKTRPKSPSSCVSDSRGGGASSSLRVSKEREREVQEAERRLRVITERYNDCFLRLRNATAELVDLRHECVRLRAENLQLSLLLAELEGQRSKQAPAVALIPRPMPMRAEAAFMCAPRSISIRSKGFLSQQQPPPPRDESTPQRLRVRASLAAEEFFHHITTCTMELDRLLEFGPRKLVGGFEHSLGLNSIFGMGAQVLLANITSNTSVMNEQNLPLGLSSTLGQEQFSAQDLHPCLFPKRNLAEEFSDASETIRNTVTMVLDGSPEEILQNYLEVMAHIRMWFITRGIDLDLSSVLGYEKVVHIVPDENTFFLAIKHNGKSCTLIIDAREAWLHGAAGSRAICQFGRGNCGPYITHEFAITLSDGGEYKAIAVKGIGEIPIGLQPLIQAVSVVDEFEQSNTLDAELSIEQSNTPDAKLSIYDAFGIFVLTFLEPLKFHEPFEIVCEAIGNGTVTTLNEKNPSLVDELKKWGKIGKDVGRHSFRVICNENVKALDLSRRRLTRIQTIDDALGNILIMPRAFIPKFVLEEVKPIPNRRVDTVWNPVDMGKGDTTPLERLYHSVLSRIQFGDNNWRYEKFIKDREQYFGSRLGGRPSSQAVNFLRASHQSANEKNGKYSAIWKSKLPVQGRELTKAVRIASRFLKFFPK